MAKKFDLQEAIKNGIMSNTISWNTFKPFMTNKGM